MLQALYKEADNKRIEDELSDSEFNLGFFGASHDLLKASLYAWESPATVTEVVKLAEPLFEVKSELDSAGYELRTQVEKRVGELAAYFLLDTQKQDFVNANLKLALAHYRSPAHADAVATAKAITKVLQGSVAETYR